MKRKETLLRVSFLIGAVTDGLAIAPMLSPKLGNLLFGGNLAKFGVEYRYAMGIGASLMAGWTVLLIWASLKPMARRDILLITIVPVIAGIVIATVYGIMYNVTELTRAIPLLVHLCFLCVLYIYAYCRSGSNIEGPDQAE